MISGAWTPVCLFQCANCKQQLVLVAFHPRFQIKVPQYTLTRYILITTVTTDQHGNFNVFHFQYNQMWPVNVTDKTEGWPVNSPISLDIARWPAVISIPVTVYSFSITSLQFLHKSYVQVQLKASYVCINVYYLHNSILLLYFFRRETICSRSHGTNKQDTVYLTQCGKSWIQKYQWVLIHCNSTIFCSKGTNVWPVHNDHQPSRLCPKKNWRKPSALNLWNPGAQHNIF